MEARSVKKARKGFDPEESFTMPEEANFANTITGDLATGPEETNKTDSTSPLDVDGDLTIDTADDQVAGNPCLITFSSGASPSLSGLSIGTLPEEANNTTTQSMDNFPVIPLGICRPGSSSDFVRGSNDTAGGVASSSHSPIAPVEPLTKRMRLSMERGEVREVGEVLAGGAIHLAQAPAEADNTDGGQLAPSRGPQHIQKTHIINVKKHGCF